MLQVRDLLLLISHLPAFHRLIDVEASVEYLHASGVADTNITVIPGAQHGQALFMPSSGMQAVCKLLSLP